MVDPVFLPACQLHQPAMPTIDVLIFRSCDVSCLKGEDVRVTSTLTEKVLDDTIAGPVARLLADIVSRSLSRGNQAATGTVLSVTEASKTFGKWLTVYIGPTSA